MVITTYNHARFLPDAIESVLSQKHRADEVIVVDDGSTDDPEAVVRRYPPVAYIRQPNRGLAAARNTGLERAHSDKIVFLDADDRLLPNALAAGLARFAQRPHCALVYGGFRHIDAAGERIGSDLHFPIGPQPYEDLLKGNVIGMHATVMYDRVSLARSGGFDAALKRCEDYDLYLRMARSLEIASHPETVAEYRRHASNMSANHREMLHSVLDVHARHFVHATSHAQTARAWREGRQVWRAYYAEQTLQACRGRGRDLRALGGAVGAVLMALTMAPVFTTRTVLKAALRRARRAVQRGTEGREAHGVKTRPELGKVRFGDFGRVEPVSADFGFDRGKPIDRHYIESFLARQATDIGGRALEVGDASYCRRFGGARITRQDVLHVNAQNPEATIVGDLAERDILPGDAFDCIVLTQTLHLVFDLPAVVREIHRALKPGGVLLLTVPGISQVDRGAWGDIWCWSLTPAAVRQLFEPVFGAANIAVESHGNVFAAITFLHGLAVEEVDVAKLDIHDRAYPVIVALRAVKSIAHTKAPVRDKGR